MRANPPSSRRKKRLGRSSEDSCFRNRLHIIGVKVSETTPDTRMAEVRVTANSCSRRPTRPVMKISGTNTATRDTLIERTVKPICRAPFRAASRGFSPASR